MTRTLSLLAVLAPFAAGCIIYEDRDGRDGPCEPGDDCDVTISEPDDGDDPVPDPPEPEPEPDEPAITGDLSLTVNQAEPGQTLLSTLIPISQEIDLSNVLSVGFERDVEVLDTIARDYEIVLLLAVDAEAELGEVDVFVETRNGPGFILSKPFHIVEGDGTGGTPGTTTGCP